MSSGDSLTIHLNLTSAPSAPRVTLSIPKDVTAKQLRASAAEASKIPLSSLKLIFRGRLIADSDRGAVDEFKIEEGCVVHCMGKPVASAEGSAPAAAAAAPTPSAASAPAGASVAAPPPASASASSASAPASDPLPAALGTIRSRCTPAQYKTALQTLDKLLGNVKSHPMEEKYRRVKKGNAAFQRRLGGLPGGHDAMLAAGFAVEQECSGDACEEIYSLTPSADAWPKLVAAKDAVATALAEAERAQQQAAAPPVGAAPAFPGMGAGGFGAPGMGMGAGGLPPMMPGMEEAAASMLSDPEALQRMLQSPMVQQMMRNDPRFANNPQMRAQMEAMLSDPNAVQQMSRLMSDPGMRQQMMNMARMQGGMGAGMGGGAGGAVPPPPTGAPGQPPMDPAAMAAQIQALQRALGQGPGNPPTGSMGQSQQTPQQQQGGASGGNSDGGENDREMTEEEMIQEAIQRSLRES